MASRLARPPWSFCRWRKVQDSSRRASDRVLPDEPSASFSHVSASRASASRASTPYTRASASRASASTPYTRASASRASAPYTRASASRACYRAFATSATRMSELASSLDEMEDILNRPTEKGSIEAKKKALKMEYDYFAYTGNSVPQVITDDMYDKLMETECGESRRTLWEMFSRREAAGDLGLVMKRRMAQHRVTKMMERVKEIEQDDFDGKIYNEIGKNKLGAPQNILPRINSNYVKQRLHPRVLHGVQFGQNMVFDLGLPFSMDRGAERRFNTHMKSIYNRNRTMWEPFNLFMCNYNPDHQPLKRLVEDPSCRSYMWNVTQKCFTDIFPHDKIVYLSPKSRNVLTEFSHDDIYVIGATGDHGNALCHVKIKEMGLRSAKLNTDPYFLRSSKNNFDIKEVFRILADARDTDSNWLYSLRHLSNPKMRVVRWRTKYQHLQNFLDEETKNQITYSSMAEDVTESHEQVFTNERSILKPRHEDAALFSEDLSSTSADSDSMEPIEISDPVDQLGDDLFQDDIDWNWVEENLEPENLEPEKLS